MSLGAINQMVAEARGKISNVEELRQLNIMLRKSGASVYDAVRGAKLLDLLNERGVGPDTLHSYIELCEKIGPERGVEAEKFVDAGMRLMSLEVKTGKNYEGVLKDFEEKIRQIEGLKAKEKSVQEEVQRLMDKKTKLGDEIREAEEMLSSTRQELNKAVSTNERLKKIGLEKVSDMARFVEGFELLGFDANMVKTLAEWRKSLKEMGINPDALGRFVKEKGPLEAQTSKMRSELKDTERKIETIRNEHRRLFEETTSLQAEALKLGKLGKVVKLGRVIIPCKVCGMEGVFVKLHTASEYRGIMRSGVALQYKCLYCGQWSMYTPWDILTEVGLMAAPEQIKEAQMPLAKD